MKFFNNEKKEENKIKTYDIDGYDIEGYNKEGYDRFGYNKDGFNKEGYNKMGYNIDGFDRNGYNRDGYDIEGLDMYGFNKDGLDKLGYDRFGYNKDGYNKYGYDKYGYNKEGYNALGYDKEGFNREGFNKDGIHKSQIKKKTYDSLGFDEEGYNTSGFNKEGFNKKGYNKEGYDKYGYNAEGFNKDHMHKNGTPYDEEGYDFNGFNKEGFNRWKYNREGIHESIVPIREEFRALAKKNIGKILFHDKFGEGKIVSITPNEDYKSGYFKVLFSHGIEKEFLFPSALNNFFTENDFLNKPIEELNYSEKEFVKERNYLSLVENKLNELSNVEYKAKTIVRDTSWNNPYDEDYDPQETEDYFYNKSMKDYWNKVALSPFFGSITIKDKSYYIGKDAILGFVYDWRSVEASPYYMYTSLTESDLDIKLVRNHTIEYKRYKSFMDLFNKLNPKNSNIVSTDEYLNQILKDQRLSKETHEIIHSIQNKQFEIISNLNNENILVNGCAGSGKTMILFHKIAYMAFHKKDFNPKEVLVISSNILLKREGDLLARELKLDRIRNYSLEGFYDSLLNSITKQYDLNIDYSFHAIQKRNPKIYNKDFLNELNFNFFECLKDLSKIDALVSKNLKIKENIFINKESIEDIIKIFSKIPFMNLIQEFKNNDLLKIKSVFKDNVEYNQKGDLLKNYTNRNLFIEYFNKDSDLIHKIDAYISYNKEIKNYNLYKEGKLPLYKLTLASFYLNSLIKDSYNLIDYKFLLLYLIKDLNIDYPFTTTIFMDEYQNYSRVEFELIKDIYPYASYNFFGDLKQRIDASGINSTLELPFLFKEYILNVNYRSSKEVCWYLNKKFDTNMQPIGVYGRAEEVSIDHLLTIDEEKDRCALIVKDFSYTKRLKTKNKCKFINVLKKDKIDRDYINILLVDDVKGLEFEKVYVYPLGMSKEEEYLASSRALRHLVVLKE